MQYTFKNSSGHGDDLLRDFLKHESLYNYLRALTNQFCGKDLKLLNFTPENCAVDDETGRHWIVKNGTLDIDAMQYISLFENRRICLYGPYISTCGNGQRGELFFDIKENCYEPFPRIQKGKMKKESHNSDPNPFPYYNVKTGWYKKYDIKLVGDEKSARILIQDILRYNNLCDYVQAIAFPESLQGDLHGTKATSPYFVYIAHERPKKIFLIKNWMCFQKTFAMSFCASHPHMVVTYLVTLEQWN